MPLPSFLSSPEYIFCFSSECGFCFWWAVCWIAAFISAMMERNRCVSSAYCNSSAKLSTSAAFGCLMSTYIEWAERAKREVGKTCTLVLSWQGTSGNKALSYSTDHWSKGLTPMPVQVLDRERENYVPVLPGTTTSYSFLSSALEIYFIWLLSHWVIKTSCINTITKFQV